MEQLINFGGRSAAFTEGLKNNAWIIRGNKLILIDISQENFVAYRDRGLFLNIKEIHIIITHTHGDHVSGIGDLGLYSFYSMVPGFTKKLSIYAPYEIVDDIYQLMRIMGCEENQYNLFILDREDVIEDIKFYTVEVNHVKPLLCFGYVIEFDGYRLYYSGDSNMIPDYILEDLYEGKFDQFYQDTCVAEYDGNVHLPISLLKKLIPKEFRNIVYCMHLDDGFPILKVEYLGFNVVKTSI